MPAAVKKLPRPVVSYPETAVLDTKQVCDALGISRTTLWRRGIPCSYALGVRKPRYVWRQVLAMLEGEDAA